MTPVKCLGREVSGGASIAVEFDNSILSLQPASPLSDLYLSPGWIDLQVNGFAGVDYNHPHTSHLEIARSIQMLFSTGVTRFYPTVITASPRDMEAALGNLSRAKAALPEGEAIAGFHVEGPHISPEDGPRGAHPKPWVRPPDFDEFLRWQEATEGQVRMVTLSPEWPGANQYIENVVSHGVVVSIGHTRATATELAGAVSAGATLSTHLGNGAHSMLPRHPNYLWEQLAEDRLMATFIVDGIHLDRSFLRVALRAKGIERSVLVTDASTPAAAKPGRYRLGKQEVDLTTGGRVVLAGQDRLAGSALRMDVGIGNLIGLADLTLAEAVRMATTNPARAGKVPHRTQGLAPGEPADLVQFRWNPQTCTVDVVATWLAGRQVFAAADRRTD